MSTTRLRPKPPPSGRPSAPPSRRTAAMPSRRSSMLPSRRTAALAVLAAAGLVLPSLAGCASGQRAETSVEHAAVDPVGAYAGLMQVRALYVVGPAPQGGQTQVHMTLVNGGTTPDSLVGGSSVDAGRLTVQAGGSGGSGAAGGASPAAVSSGATSGGAGVTVAAGALVPLQGAGDVGTVTLTGLKHPLTAGSSVQLTLTFANAGSVSIPAVPVEGPQGAGSTPVPPTPLSSAPPGSPTGGSPTPSVGESPGLPG